MHENQKYMPATAECVLAYLVFVLRNNHSSRQVLAPYSVEAYWLAWDV
jgi:hypothetical protein